MNSTAVAYRPPGRATSVAAMALISLLATPPGMLGVIQNWLGIGVFAVAGFYLFLLILQLVENGRAHRMPVISVVCMTLMIVMYLTMPRFLDDFQAGGRGRETVGVWLSAVIVYVLGHQLVRASVDRIRILERLCMAILLACSLTATVVIAQHLGTMGGLEGELSHAGFGNPVHAAVYCGLGFFLALNELASQSPRRKFVPKTVVVLMALLLVAAIVISTSRTVWLLALLAILIAARQRRVSVYRFLGLGLMLVALLGSIWFYGPARERLQQEELSTGRTYLWAQLLPRDSEELFLGRGVGYMWSLRATDISPAGGYVSDFNESVYAHNDLLFLLVEVGLGGVLLWLVFVFYHLHAAFRSKAAAQRNPSGQKARGVLLFCAGAIVIVQAVDTLFFGYRNFSYIALLMGASAAALQQRGSFARPMSQHVK